LERLYEYVEEIVGGPPTVPKESTEWIVPEAREDQNFLRQIRKLHDLIAKYSSNAEVVITLYVRHPTKALANSGVGEFEYDLIYCRNIRDKSPMFGPTVKDDDRTRFCGSTAVREAGFIGAKKPGGFAAREDILSYARFKLASGLWRDGGNPPPAVDRSQIAGLLFVNGRHAPISDFAVSSDRFRARLSSVEEFLASIEKARRTSLGMRLASLPELWHFQLGDRPRLASINDFFSAALSNATASATVAASVFLYIENDGSAPHGDRCLKWIWSDGPTDVPATIPLGPDETLTIAAVALDPNNKPLLIHNLGATGKGKPIRTKLKGTSRSNLIVPLLSADARLLGVLDLQSSNPDEFDTLDVQVAYFISRHFLAKAMEAIRAHPESLPLHTTERYEPFPKAPLGFEIAELTSLSFNPMKFLLHWVKVRELIETGTTKTPATVEVWPTMECNHGCVWCRTLRERNEQARHKDMSDAELDGIARDIRNFGKVDVLISGGGEPLLHPYIAEFMKTIGSIDGSIGIFSNGTRPANWNFGKPFLHLRISIGS
jgi:hypothetical protein